MEPIIKHTSKAAPHLSFRPEQTTLRTTLCLFSSVEMRLATVAALIFRTHTDDITEDPGFCEHAINLCVCCLYVNITSLILFELVLPYR